MLRIQASLDCLCAAWRFRSHQSRCSHLFDDHLDSLVNEAVKAAGKLSVPLSTARYMVVLHQAPQQLRQEVISASIE